MTQGREVVSKLAGSTSEIAVLGKKAFPEAMACQDGVCAAVLGIGCLIDCLQMIASLIPGSNITITLTTLVSVICKVLI